VLDATFSPVVTSKDKTTQPEGREKCATAVEDARALFIEVAERDGNADRSGLLAQLELEKRCRKYNLDTSTIHSGFPLSFLNAFIAPSQMLKLMQDYLHRVGGKACCFEDLKPYLDLSGEELTSWISFLGQAEVPVVSPVSEHIRIDQYLSYRRVLLPYKDTSTSKSYKGFTSRKKILPLSSKPNELGITRQLISKDCHTE
jgi:N-terminal acetyltransferase B complex non-catalytic subunit